MQFNACIAQNDSTVLLKTHYAAYWQRTALRTTHAHTHTRTQSRREFLLVMSTNSIAAHKTRLNRKKIRPEHNNGAPKYTN